MRKILGVLLLLSLNLGATQSFAGFAAVYRQPQTAAEATVAQQLQQNQVLDKLAASLNRIVSTPGTVPIVAQSCGQVNAYYARDRREVIICYELLTAHFAALQKSFGRQLDRARLNQILMAELVFALTHEVGHAMFDLHKIPLTGKEEDAADEFAAFLMLNTNGYQVIKDAPLYLQAFKVKWYNKIGNAGMYADEHSITEQRVVNLVCYGYGKDPQQFQDAAMMAKLTQDRASRCPREYEQMERSMRTLLGDKLTLGNNNQAAPPQARQQYQQPRQIQPVPSPAASNEGAQMLSYYRCTNCHDMDVAKIGPAFRQIANHYRGQDITQQLIYNIKVGSQGIWGQVPAPPMTHIPENEAEQMARWILAIGS